MRELSQSQEAPSLFDAPPPQTYLQAKDFVKWCCSFGPEFRNSPDASNLRYWAHKNKIKIDQPDEREILESAREIYLKRIEQRVRQSERAETPPN
jgi:hypothetical protein